MAPAGALRVRVRQRAEAEALEAAEETEGAGEETEQEIEEPAPSPAPAPDAEPRKPWERGYAPENGAPADTPTEQAECMSGSVAGGARRCEAHAQSGPSTRSPTVVFVAPALRSSLTPLLNNVRAYDSSYLHLGLTERCLSPLRRGGVFRSGRGAKNGELAFFWYPRPI